MRPELEVVPRDKFDLAAAGAAANAGWPALEPVAGQLLEWVQDPNWPVARVLAPVLASVGAPLAPYVRQVLAGEDGAWKYHLIETVVIQSPELSAVLLPELERIAFHPSPSESAEAVATVALAALEQS